MLGNLVRLQIRACSSITSLSQTLSSITSDIFKILSMKKKLLLEIDCRINDYLGSSDYDIVRDKVVQLKRYKATSDLQELFSYLYAHVITQPEKEQVRLDRDTCTRIQTFCALQIVAQSARTHENLTRHPALAAEGWERRHVLCIPHTTFHSPLYSASLTMCS